MTRATSGLLIGLIETNDENLPLTLRLQGSIRALLIDGHARYGDKLPSSRLLARDLGLARETVEAAYRQLEVEGYLVRRHGSGTYVATPEHAFTAKLPSSNRRRSSRAHIGLSARGSMIARDGGVVDHGAAAPFVILPDVRPFPLHTWQRLTTRVLKAKDTVPLLYADAQGYPPLREEIACYLAAHRAVHCGEKNILVLSSSQQALTLIALLLGDPQQQFAIEEPGFHGARFAFQAAGIELVPIPVDAKGLNVDILAGLKVPPRAVYVTPSHQYPLAVTLTLDRRLALIDWAKKSKCWIIEDDYDSEYRYDGRPIASIQSLDTLAPVLYLGTFSKVLFPSLRLAYLVLPEALMPAFVAGRTLMDGHSNIINQVVLAEFMKSGDFTAHIRRMRQLYTARRNAFCEAFHKHLARFGTAQTPPGGLHLAVRLNDDLSEEATVGAAKNALIELPTLRRLFGGPRKQNGWLMGFAALTPDEARANVVRLAKEIQRKR